MKRSRDYQKVYRERQKQNKLRCCFLNNDQCCQKFHLKLLAHSEEEEKNEWKSLEEKVSQDLLAVNNIFNTRNNEQSTA